MIAGDVFLTRARPWLVEHRREVIRSLIPLLSLVIVWWIAAAQLEPGIWFGLTIYALAHLLLIGLRRRRRGRSEGAVVDALLWLSMPVDLLFSLLLISHASGLGNAIYALYILISLRALAVQQQLLAATITPFLLGPAYLLAYHFGHHTLADLTLDQLTQWALLFSSLGFGMMAIWSSTIQQHTTMALQQELRAERLNREAQMGELERTAADLRARMRAMHALEEGLRVITSTLSLDEVLNQIVDCTAQMLGPGRLHGITLSLLVGDDFEHRSSLPGEVDRPWAAPLARRMLDQQVPLIVGDATLDSDLAEVARAGLRSALCVPLFVGEGAPRGSLAVVSTHPAAFSSSDARHLSAFAIQAGIAIQNAEMHSSLQRQRGLLEAVIRDINDGLVVVGARHEIVLANPLGHDLQAQTVASTPVRNLLLELTASMRAENRPTLTREIRLDAADEESERVYEAFASQVHQQDGTEPLIAIVLHDITAQKAEERTRTEFISMVSHELRNPLNSLNGFIKVVLQGRAGALLPLQQEFLEIADGQIERLKGRVAELLEFNRIEAGRLVLAPDWNNLTELVAGTVARLRLQAEQAGLVLINEVCDELPACFFDSERIGQVLTNLIENAIKATAPGGLVTLRSELHDGEIRVRIYDTGVGIPPEDQAKIFQRFYRAHHRASSEGNHLGLGLAICRQIIEGHHGRIWVESEVGQGSCFTFALPLANQHVKREA